MDKVNVSTHTVKGYELREQVGAGGFGAVYRAYQPAVGREVAIKVILPEYANHPDFIRRFTLEAELIARLEHPHIVPLYDYWRDPDGAYLVMRWLHESLGAALRRGPWSLEAVARLLEQVAAALSVAHREGIVHRDIKPDNILLDEDENAYLADFGIAKDLSVGSVTQGGAMVGSPAYITPEQIKGEPVTIRADIYSLGLVIYEALASEKPYPRATTPVELIHHHLNTPLPRVTLHRPNLPTVLDEILQTATAKDPSQRYPTVQRFAAAFRAAIPVPSRVQAQPLPEPLTGRELDILQLMVEGLSNQEIAQKLCLALETVRWYVKQIYSKLDVHGRRQATERARQLDLLGGSRFASMASAAPALEPEPTFAARPKHTLSTSQLVNPYKGLRAFQETDAADFFGRATLTERLLARLSESGDGGRFLTLVGPSGSGKSSLVKAGLIPALRKGGLPGSERWFITDMLPGDHPLEELEAALLRVATSSLPGLLEQLGEDRRGLVRAAKRLLPGNQEVELVLVIDQFEELFTLVTDEKLRLHFIDNLLSAASDPRSRVRIVLTLRADFYDRPLLYPRLAELVRSHGEVILPLTQQELERAIAGPAERVGLVLEPGLVNTIVNDVGEQPGTLPLVQYALTELFERREEVTLTVDAYRASGGISGALARRADDLYADLDPANQAAAKQLFLRLVTLGEGTEDTRRRVLQAELGLGIGSERAIDDVMTAFNQYRLLTFDRDPLTRGPTVEIAHEALIREWKLLRQWLDENRDELRVQRRLMDAASEWAKARQDSSFLASGARLAQFETLAADSHLALNESEKGYLLASIAERTRQEKEAEARQSHELALAHQAAESAKAAEASQSRAANRLRYLAAVLLIAVLGALGLTGVALGAEQSASSDAATATNAQGQAQNAAATATNAQGQAQAVAATSVAYANRLARAQSQLLGRTASILAQPGRDQNAELAALLALQALKLYPSFEAYDGLMDANAVFYARRVYTFDVIVTKVGYSSDGQRILIGTMYGGADLLDAQTGQRVGEFSGSGQTAVFSPDGQQVLTFQSNIVQLWDAATGQKTRAFPNADGLFDAGVALSSAGRYLLGVSAQHVARLWDVTTGQPVSVFDVGDRVRRVTLSPDGRYAMIAYIGVTGGRLWDTQTGQPVQAFGSPADMGGGVAFSPDGKTVLAGSPDHTVRLWDVITGSEVQRFSGHSDAVTSVAFSPDGTRIAAGGMDHQVLVWDVQSGALLGTFRGHTDIVLSVAFSPDGKSVLSVSTDRTARLWDIRPPQRFIPLMGSDKAVLSMAISHDSKYVLTGSDDGMARLWDAATGQAVRTIRYDNPVTAVALSPDDRYIVVGSVLTSTAGVFDVTTGQRVRTLGGGMSGLVVAAFSPDGRYLLFGSDDNTASLWDASSGSRLWTASGHTQAVNGVAFSPDGKYVLTGSGDHTAKLWDAATGQVVRTFAAHSQQINSVAYSPDGKYVLTGSDDHTAKLWDAATGQVVRTFAAHTNAVYGVAYSPDGKYILTASSDKTTRLWDAATGEQLRVLETNAASVCHCDPGSVVTHGQDIGFSPDGKYLVMYSDNSTPEILNTDYQGAVAFACSRLTRDLTDIERVQFSVVGTEPSCPKFDKSSQPALPIPRTGTPTPTAALPS